MRETTKRIETWIQFLMLLTSLLAFAIHEEDRLTVLETKVDFLYEIKKQELNNKHQQINFIQTNRKENYHAN
jgi:hypothetical protein